MTDFIPFPKVPRLTRECVVTEKIDGTNASIWIDDVGDELTADQRAQCVFADHAADGRPYWIRAASRKRFITPGKSNDNFGFAGWVRDNAEELVKLGAGVHHGEWWGGKIQRGYGLQEKRFSLFNTSLWNEENTPECCYVVPVLLTVLFTSELADQALSNLDSGGSLAADGFDNPEGTMIYHTAANQYFKKTFDVDLAGKQNV